MPRSNFGFCCWREPLAWSLWYVSRFRSLVKANPSNFWVGWSYYLLYSTDIISIKSAVSWMDQHIATANNVFIVYRWLPFAEWHRRARCIISLTLRVYLSFIYMTPFASLLLQLVYRNIQMSVSPKERGKRPKCGPQLNHSNIVYVSFFNAASALIHRIILALYWPYNYRHELLDWGKRSGILVSRGLLRHKVPFQPIQLIP